MNCNYKVVDKDTYYRKGVFRHFSEDCKCSVSMTARIDVTELVNHSRKTNTKFYLNFLYLLSKVMNSREDYRMGYLWQTAVFYSNAYADLERAKKTREYGLDSVNHPNWFDASYISWLSYDSLNIELPDGYLFFAPIINWGKYREENGKLVMPVSVRLNHAIADGYLVANVFRLLQQEVETFVNKSC